MIALFWGSTTLLVLTNIEIESLCLSFCLIGITGMRISREFVGGIWEKALSRSTVVLAIYFLLIGGVSLARHSRLSYRGNVFPGETIPSDGEPAYLRGVQLSRQAVALLASIVELEKKNNGIPVYWGPGLEMMNRVYGGTVDPALPLWFHNNVTVRDIDSQKLIDAIARSRAGLVVIDRNWVSEIPSDVLLYLNHDWTKERDGTLLVYRRKSGLS
jgi:hypothetical protein